MLRFTRLESAGGLFACTLLALTAAAFAQQKAKPVRLTLTTIDVPGAMITEVGGINTAGVMVGNYRENTGGAASGFSYSNGQFSYFDYHGQSVTVPMGINDSNLIVGYASQLPSEGAPVYGFVYDGISFTTLTHADDYATYAFGINNAGTIGCTAGSLYGTAAFELLGTLYRRINLPGGCTYKDASGINNRNDVVGYTVCGIYDYGYVVKNGQLQNIDYPGAQETAPLGINDSGTIVGWYNPVSATDYSFISRNGKYISFTYPGAKYTFAIGINKSGLIVGEYTFDDITYHGFVSSPVTGADFKFSGCCQTAAVEGR